MGSGGDGPGIARIRLAGEAGEAGKLNLRFALVAHAQACPCLSYRTWLLRRWPPPGLHVPHDARSGRLRVWALRHPAKFRPLEAPAAGGEGEGEGRGCRQAGRALAAVFPLPPPPFRIWVGCLLQDPRMFLVVTWAAVPKGGGRLASLTQSALSRCLPIPHIRSRYGPTVVLNTDGPDVVTEPTRQRGGKGRTGSLLARGRRVPKMNTFLSSPGCSPRPRLPGLMTATVPASRTWWRGLPRNAPGAYATHEYDS